MKNSNRIKRILFILDGYPILGSRACVFVRNLIVSLSDLGVECTVIAPKIISKSTLSKNKEYYFVDITENGTKIKVFMPFYLHLSSRRYLLGLSMKNHQLAVESVINREKLKFDAVYGHFIYQCGLTASIIGHKYNVPSFLGAGESDKLLPNSQRCRGAYQVGLKKYHWFEILSKLTGVISVSEWTKSLLIDGGFISENANIGVFPNGVNKTLFYPYDKYQARLELGVGKDAFVVCFVGAFNENKGAERVVEALKKINEGIEAIFIGRDGPSKPIYDHSIFVGQCSNELIPRYLQASDCFVLPTKSEGCCNAILEALSCGIPVISSKMPFNYGILDHTNSILIDPNDIDEIASAIKHLKDNPEVREKLSYGARVKSKDFDIAKRAANVYGFMENLIYVKD